MRISHVGDIHGNFNKLGGRFDIIVFSGDFCPDFYLSQFNCSESDKARVAALQLDWISDNISNIKQWTQHSPFLFILGNHDWIKPELVEFTLRSQGIEAISLNNKLVTYQGINFYGFPYVPAINGSFNYEREIPEMITEVDEMFKTLNQTHVDVLVTHAPLYKVLDITNGNYNIGNRVLSNMIDFKLSKDMIPNYLLCSHCHEARGMAMYNGMLVSNAAQTQNIVEIL